MKLVPLFLLVLSVPTQAHLHKLVKYFEPLNYDVDKLLHQHNRLRRSVQNTNNIQLTFGAFQKAFDLHLGPDNQYSNFNLFVNGLPHPKSTSNSYQYTGYDMNNPSTTVYGSVAFGVFDGAIYTPNEIYHIEPANRYYTNVSHHSVIYRQSDTIMHDKTSQSGGKFCGVTNTDTYVPRQSDIHTLHSRDKSSTRDADKTQCHLNIVGDHHFYGGVTDSDSIENVRIAQAISVIKNIVSGGSENFRNTDFDKDGRPDGVHFGIQTINIYTDNDYNISDEFIGIESLLEKFSKSYYNDYCLSYLFTHRDFNGGLLGLAYIGEVSSNENKVGVCSKYTKDGKSINTGIVTLINYGKRVSNAQSQRTFTHEAGHNFGALHDTEECGNDYVMFAHASDGRHENNNKFSECSIDYISPILEIAQSNTGCLRHMDDTCGNNLVDPGEYCDCGTSNGICNDDPCCNGSSCMLSKYAACSPQQGPCCNASTCQFVEAFEELICSEETECAYSQVCNGTAAHCPKADLTEAAAENETAISCNGGSNYCVEGECTGSVCIPLGLPSCECLAEDYQCHVCCEDLNGRCVSTVLIAEQNMTARMLLPDNMGHVLGVGFPCNNFTGYCDFFNNCRYVDSDGAIKRLTSFFQDTIFQTFIVYTDKYWWSAPVGFTVLLIVMFIFVLVCHFCLPRPEHMKRRIHNRLKLREKRLNELRRSNRVNPSMY